MSEPNVTRPRLKKSRCCCALLTLGLLALGIGVASQHHSLPKGTPGPEAEARTRALEDAVNLAAWKRTGAVRWTFAGRQHHLWDRTRNLARVRWGQGEVLLRLGDQTGRAWRDGVEVTDPAQRDPMLAKAWAHWCNDSFWLNPIAKLRDRGTKRSLVTLDDGRQGLLVGYDSGGVTPGDHYLWIPGDDGLPVAWRMWVSVVPLGGLEATWEDWVTLDTGAKVATRHRIAGLVPLPLADVAGNATLRGLLGTDVDPFAPLAGR